MSIGTVKFWNETKGFGFIIPEDGGNELFAHITEVNSDSLQEDDEVEYEIAESDKGSFAVEITNL